MQREEDGYVIISCDFCHTDWDQNLPMIEGHRGSVICLACFQQALDHASVSEDEFHCTLCQQTLPGSVRHWSSPTTSAAVCWPDIRQAAKAFHKDKDIDFRWDPAKYPVQAT